MGEDTICDVGGLMTIACMRSVRNFLPYLYLKCHKNILLRRNFHQFGSVNYNNYLEFVLIKTNISFDTCKSTIIVPNLESL